MVPVVSKLAVVGTTIHESVQSIAVPLIVLEVSQVGPSVGPLHPSLSVHLTLLPLALVGQAIRPLVDAFSCHFSVGPVAFVSTAVGPDPNAKSVLLTKLVSAKVLRTVCPRFLSLSMLHIAFPLAFVPRSLCCYLNTESVGFPLLELTVEEFSVAVVEASFTFHVVFVPLPSIDVAGDPHVDTVALPQLGGLLVGTMRRLLSIRRLSSLYFQLAPIFQSLAIMP